MRAWIERIAPPGEPISLPDGAGSIVFGTSRKATIVVEDALVSAKHCELYWERGFWRVKDLGTPRGTTVNASPLRYPRALTRGDVVGFGLTSLRFMCEVPEENEPLRQAVLAAPDDPSPIAVWADWLQEHGDPLGERLANALRGGRIDHQPWLGPSWDVFLSGQLELEWRHGLLRRATLRAVAGKETADVAGTVGALTGLRVAIALESLVVDLVRLTPPFHPAADPGIAARGVSIVANALQLELARRPVLPLLRTLSFGTAVDPPGFDVHPVPALLERYPHLGGQALLPLAKHVRLVVLDLASGTSITGVSDGQRELLDVTRLRAAPDRRVHLETPPRLAGATYNPCYFARVGQGWTLFAGDLKGTLKVNGRADATWPLMAQDVIELPGAVRLRFEMLP